MVVRTDTNQPKAFRASKEWNSEQLENASVVDKQTGQKKLHSFSGHERNCLFLNRKGKEFTDLSMVSGLDNIADGRTFVYWDYDRDGWQDIALVNANSPLLNFYRNSLGTLSSDNRSAGQFIAVRYVGANRSAVPSPGQTCRDGYGARAEVDLGEMRIIRELRSSEGFCAQNSDTMIIGIGRYQAAKSLTVHWPSGKSQTIHNAAAGTQLTAYENAEESADGSGFDAVPYRAAAPPGTRATADGKVPGGGPMLSLVPASTSNPDSQTPPALRIYTTMATWCEACQRHLPQIEALRAALPSDTLEIYGVPIDFEDTTTKLKEYESTFEPAYRLLVDLTVPQRSQVIELLNEVLGSQALPSTIVTDSEGRVLQWLAGVPTVSDVRKWTRQQTSPP